MARACERVERCAHCKYPVSAKSIRAHENRCRSASPELRACWRRTGRWVLAKPRVNRAAKTSAPEQQVCRLCGFCVRRSGSGMHWRKCSKVSAEERAYFRARRRWRKPSRTQCRICRPQGLMACVNIGAHRRQTVWSGPRDRREELARFIESCRYGASKSNIIGSLAQHYEGAQFRPQNALGRVLLRDLQRLAAAGRIVRVAIPYGAIYCKPGHEELARSREVA